jgi:hypothetical protein
MKLILFLLVVCSPQYIGEPSEKGVLSWRELMDLGEQAQVSISKQNLNQATFYFKKCTTDFGKQSD